MITLHCRRSVQIKRGLVLSHLKVNTVIVARESFLSFELFLGRSNSKNISQIHVLVYTRTVFILKRGQVRGKTTTQLCEKSVTCSLHLANGISSAKACFYGKHVQKDGNKHTINLNKQLKHLHKLHCLFCPVFCFVFFFLVRKKGGENCPLFISAHSYFIIFACIDTV